MSQGDGEAGGAEGDCQEIDEEGRDEEGHDEEGGGEADVRALGGRLREGQRAITFARGAVIEAVRWGHSLGP